MTTNFIFQDQVMTISSRSFKVSLSFTDYPARGERLAANARAYVWLKDSELPTLDTINAEATRLGLGSIYTMKEDFPTMDALWSEHNREIVKAQRLVLTTLITSIKDGDTRLDEKINKFKFSTKAGCSCGCSPGWILRGLSGRYSIYITEIDEAAEALKALKAQETTAAAFDPGI